MNKIYSLILTLLIGFAVASCSDEFVDGLTFTNDPHYLSVDKSSLSFGSDAGTQSFAVTSIGTSWTVSNNASWITLSTNVGTSSADVPVAVSENTEYSDKNRAAVLDITGSNGVKSRTVTVNQEAPDLHLSVSTNSVGFEAQGGLNQIVNVVCNNSWNISAADDSWLSVTKEAASIKLTTLSDNTTGAERHTMISVQSGNKIETIKVTQKAGTISVSPQTLSFDYISSTQKVTVKSDVAWTATNENNWVTVSPTSGSANQQVTVSVTVKQNSDKASRQGIITFLDKVLTVNQNAFQSELSVSKTNVNFSGSANSTSITVTSNETWSYSCTSDWLTVTRTSSGLSLSAKENTTTDSRTVYIIVTAGNESKQITVTQLPASITNLPSSLSFDFSKSSQNFSFTSEASWKANTSYSWISISPSLGTAGTTRLYVSVSENASRDARTGSFTINNKTVSVTQSGVTLSVSPSSLAFSENGETLKLTITSNTSWKINNTKSWLTFSKTEGTGTQTIDVTASNNPDTAREGTITIETTNGITTEIKVSQDGLGIQVITDLTPFTTDGGSTVFTQKETSSWTAKVEDGVDWIHITPTSGFNGVTLTITADKNTSVSSRTSYVDVTYATSGITYRLMINQYGLGITCNVSSYNFLAKGGASDAITVLHDGDVNIQTSDSWFTAKLSGNLLTITAAENHTGSQRTGTVTLTLIGTSKSVTINVTQAFEHGDISIDDYGEWETVSEHTAVDLGLSVKWATMNVGATSPEDYGDYFAWGETTGYNSGKTNFDWSTYKYCNGSYSSMTKYCTDSIYGTVDNKTTLESSDDAAHVNWGGSWRMPTDAELTELRTKCTWTWTTLNGVNGYKVIGNNGNSIFLPAAGYRSNSDLLYAGSDGIYRSGSLLSSYSYYACSVYFNSGNVLRYDFGRYLGHGVRAVCP